MNTKGSEFIMCSVRVIYDMWEIIHTESCKSFNTHKDSMINYFLHFLLYTLLQGTECKFLYRTLPLWPKTANLLPSYPATVADRTKCTPWLLSY